MTCVIPGLLVRLFCMNVLMLVATVIVAVNGLGCAVLLARIGWEERHGMVGRRQGLVVPAAAHDAARSVIAS